MLACEVSASIGWARGRVRGIMSMLTAVTPGCGQPGGQVRVGQRREQAEQQLAAVQRADGRLVRAAHHQHGIGVGQGLGSARDAGAGLGEAVVGQPRAVTRA